MAFTARTWGVMWVSGDLIPLFLSMGHSYVMLVLLRGIPSPSGSVKAPATAHQGRRNRARSNLSADSTIPDGLQEGFTASS